MNIVSIIIDAPIIGVLLIPLWKPSRIKINQI
jgi:hypothetical protein